MKRVLGLLVVLSALFSMLTAGAAYAEEKPLIELGDYNEDVISLHQKLSELGLYDLRAESPWSIQSSEALKMLQRYLDMDATGIVADQGELEQILTVDSVDRAALALAQIEENLFVEVEYSAGASSNGEGGYTFITDVEGNAFNSARLQLYSTDSYLGDISSGGVRIYEGDYVFPYEDGEYVLRFKANSNKRDEAVAKAIRLKKNCVYHFFFDVNSIESNRVETGSVIFGERK